MMVKNLCKLGEQIEIQLIKNHKTNAWLISQVSADTGLYFDRSYLHKIKVGKLETPKIVNCICKILGIERR